MKNSNAKSGLAIIGTIILIVLQLTLGIIQFSDSSPTPAKNDWSAPIIKKPSTRTPKIDVPYFMTGERTKLREVTQLVKDSVFPILPNVTINLSKGFHLFDTSRFSTTAIFAKYSKFYVAFDSIPAVENQSLTLQWESFREDIIGQQSYTTFLHEDEMSYEYKGITIEKKNFIISSLGTNLRGVATLMEFEGMRYFFHFVSEDRTSRVSSSSYLRKYLDVYLKIR